MGDDVIHTIYGPMSDRFTKAPLHSLCVSDYGVQTGPFGSQLHASNYVEFGTPIITVEHLGENRLIHKNLPRITDEDKVRLARYTIITGDIIFSRVGSVDRRAIVQPNENGWLFSGRCLRVRPDQSKIDPAFLSYFFGYVGFKGHIRQIAVGATMPSLNTTILGNVPIYYPPLAEQKAIAHILGTLDDKIELNRKMNENLESIARAIFKSWFVDFDPVRAKMDGRQPAGMDAETAALFPDGFEDSELGKIPKGWKVNHLEKHIVALKGLSYKGESLSDAGMPLHNLNSVYEGGGYKYEGIKYYSGKYKDRHLIEPGDLIVTNTEQGHECLLIGYAAIIPNNFGETGIFSHHLYSVKTRTKSPMMPHYLCELFNSRKMHDIISGYGNGTTVNMLPIDALQKPMIVVPPSQIIDKYENLAISIYSRRESLISENNTLSSLRDTLLPKLISGQLRIPDAEKMVEDAA